MSRKLFLCFVLLATACSGGSDDAGSDDQIDGATETTVAEEAAEAPTETTVAEIPDEPGLPMANGVDIEQLTATSGGGARPMLTWTPIDAAESYTVVVYDAEGSPWWSWSGSHSEVVIGGVATDAEIGGPRAASGVRWVVMGFDVDGNLVGTSPKRGIEP